MHTLEGEAITQGLINEKIQHASNAINASKNTKNMVYVTNSYHRHNSVDKAHTQTYVQVANDKNWRDSKYGHINNNTIEIYDHEKGQVCLFITLMGFIVYHDTRSDTYQNSQP